MKYNHSLIDIAEMVDTFFVGTVCYDWVLKVRK